MPSGQPPGRRAFYNGGMMEGSGASRLPSLQRADSAQIRRSAMKRSSFFLRATVVALILALAPAAPAATKYKYKILHTFTGGSDGGLVATAPTLDASGNVYGTTYWGGSERGQDCGDPGCGVIFELSPNKNGDWKENVLLDFEDDTGSAYWYQPLLFNGSGNLFGSTTAIDYKAYIFELTPESGGWQFNSIYEPAGYCLVFDQAGDLYGCMDGIGELSPGQNGWTYTNITQETTAYSPLSWDTKGSLYGTNVGGGKGDCNPPGCGYAWQLTPNGDGTWTYQVIFYFGLWKNDGVLPSSGLVLDAAGNAYGVTFSGGEHNCGIVYELDPPPPGADSYWGEKVLYNFPSGGGCAPFFNLAIDASGSLYGVALGGDPHCGCGVVFKLAPQKSGKRKYSTLHIFRGPDGAGPNGVIVDGKGNIFGTAGGGGKYNMGVAFELSP